jgi:hypothetical protein
MFNKFYLFFQFLTSVFATTLFFAIIAHIYIVSKCRWQFILFLIIIFKAY